MRLPISTFAAIFITTPTLAFASETTTQKQTEAFFAALEVTDIEMVSNMVTDDVVTTIPFAASGDTTADAMRVFTGREQVMAYFGQASQFIPQVAFVDTEITVSSDGETAFVETRGDMTLADGRSYQNLYVWRLDFEGGKISAITEYLNPVTAAIAFNRPIGPQEASN